MTLLCKCNWCGECADLTLDFRSLEYMGKTYHYCAKCEKEIQIALDAGKEGQMGKFHQFMVGWEDMRKSLNKWAKETNWAMAMGSDRRLMMAIERFNKRVEKFSEGEE